MGAGLKTANPPIGHVTPAVFTAVAKQYIAAAFLCILCTGLELFFLMSDITAVCTKACICAFRQREFFISSGVPNEDLQHTNRSAVIRSRRARW